MMKRKTTGVFPLTYYYIIIFLYYFILLILFSYINLYYYFPLTYYENQNVNFLYLVRLVVILRIFSEFQIMRFCY